MSTEQITMAHTYDRVFSHADGQVVLEDLRRSFGDRQSFVAGDPFATAFREGQRAVYLAVLDLLNLARDPARYAQPIEVTEE